MKKSHESIWTKDLTPGIVNFMTRDISPDFSGEMWTKDITHHVIGTLAVFGLVVSAFVTTLGVTAVSVNVEMAIAQQASSQTASVMMAENRVAPMASTIVGQRPPKMEDHMGSTTMGSSTKLMAQEARAMFCPKIERSIARGASQATTTGEVGQLQQFIANHFNLDPKDIVTGHFGSTTEGYLKKFQQEQGIAPAPMVGPLTRAAIARLCNPSAMDPMNTKGDVMRDAKGAMGSSTMGTSSMPKPPKPPMPPKATAAPTVVSYQNDSSNAASVIEAVNQISDGYGKLLSASLGLLGL